MKNNFSVKAINESGYVKFYITHVTLKGRIKKHVGKGVASEYFGCRIELINELEKHFEGKVISNESILDFVNKFFDIMKLGCNIFNYQDEFIEEKRNTYNSKTDTYLSNSSINSYKKSIEYFKNFLRDKGITPSPENVNKRILDDFFHFLNNKGYNYRVKLHSRIKEFLKFLISKNINIDKTFVKSTFTEKYDHDDVEDDDIALTKSDLDKLISLRKDFISEKVHLPLYNRCKNLPEHFQIKQREQKYRNLRQTLDCFLYMSSVGMYFSDIKKSSISLGRSEGLIYLNYRRAKNNSYCKCIPVVDTDCFLLKTLIGEYSIKSKSNFPLKLSLDKFDEHLKTIGQMAGLDFNLTSKMARKTFASFYYFKYRVHINDIQLMLGHSDRKHTLHYLRIKENDLADKIYSQLQIAI